MSPKLLSKNSISRRLIWIITNLAALLAFSAFTPLEKTLGANIRLVYLHGAWVWAGLAAFGLSALAGLTGLGLQKTRLLRWSESLGWTGLLFWLTYLPMSLVVMKINWGGFYFDEPRWRIPMTYALVGVLLQAGQWLVRNPRITAAGNMLFGIALWWSTLNMRSVLHPDSPVFQSDSLLIQIYFGGLLAMMCLLGYQIAAWFVKVQDRRSMQEDTP